MELKTFDDPNEKLFRAVWPTDTYWKDNGKVSSAAFSIRKGEDGISVQRALKRNDSEVIRSMSKLHGGIVYVTTRTCKEEDVKIEHKPSRDSYWHSILITDRESRIANKQRLKLARAAIVVRDRDYKS